MANQAGCFQRFGLDDLAEILADRMNRANAAAPDILQDCRHRDGARTDHDVDAQWREQRRIGGAIDQRDGALGAVPFGQQRGQNITSSSLDTATTVAEFPMLASAKISGSSASPLITVVFDKVCATAVARSLSISMIRALTPANCSSMSAARL